MKFGWNHFQNNVFQQMNDKVEVNGDQLHHRLCSADERKLTGLEQHCHFCGEISL